MEGSREPEGVPGQHLRVEPVCNPSILHPEGADSLDSNLGKGFWETRGGGMSALSPPHRVLALGAAAPPLTACVCSSRLPSCQFSRSFLVRASLATLLEKKNHNFSSSFILIIFMVAFIT